MTIYSILFLGSSEGLPSGQRLQTVNLSAYAFEGSNPSPSTKPKIGEDKRGCSSMVEFQPSKLATWVRFPSPAPNTSIQCI